MWFTSTLRRDLLIPTAVTVAIVTLLHLGLFQHLELLSEDARFAYRGFVHRHDASDVVVIGITHQSIEQLGEPPWPRHVYAEAVERLTAMGAEVICLDVVFQADFQNEGDQRLVRAVERAGNVILPVFCPVSLENYSPGPLISVDTLRQNFPALTTAAAGLGHINVPLGIDSKCRAVPFALEYAGQHYRNFALECATLFAQRTKNRHTPLSPATERFTLGEIPLTEDGKVLVNFSGHHLSVGLYPFHELLAGRVPRSRIARRVVLIGQTALGRVNADVVTTPVGPMYGVILHSTLIDSLLKNHLLVRQSLISMLLTVTLVSLLSGVLLAHLRWWVGLVAWLGLTALTCVSAATVFDQAGYIVQVIPILGVLTGNYLFAILTSLKRSTARLKQQHEALEGVLDAGQTALTAAAPEDTPQILAALIGRTLEVEAVRLDLADGNRCWYWCRPATEPSTNEQGLDAETIQAFERTRSQSHPDNAPHLDNVLQATPNPQAGAPPPIRSVLCIPLQTRESLLGHIRFYNRRPRRPHTESRFEADDVSLATALAQQAAIALYNLLLKEDLELRNQQLEETAETLRKAQEQLVRQEKLAAVGQMAAMIIHDIRGPIGALLGIGELLQQPEYKPDDAAEFGGIIVEEATQVNSMIQDLLDYTRGTNSLVCRETTPAEILRTLEARIRTEFRGNGIQWRVNKDCQACIHADGDKLLRVLLNLCRNAAAVSKNGSSIQVSCTLAGNQAVFRVQDTGPGIPPDLRAHLFSPFVSGGRGSGLGLAIAKRITEDHGGTIAVENSSASGTTIAVRLPTLGKSLPGQGLLDASGDDLGKLR